VIDRHAANTPISKAYADVFPSTYPFALVVLNPDSSLSARGRDAAEIDDSGKPLLNCGLGETAVTILVLIMACPRPRLNNWLEDLLEIEGPRAVADLLRNFFDVALSILQHEAFPANWLNASLMAHTVVLKLLGPVAALLGKSYVPSIDHAESFNTLLWGDCLNLLCELLASEELVIEEFSAQKRRAVWKLAGDLRGHGASILLQLWNALGWPSSGGEGLMRSGGVSTSKEECLC
jgi:dedicator of cytokinesis protein 3